MRHTAFSIRQRMALDACTECGQCLAVCPAVAASGDADLSAQVRMDNLKKLLRDRNFFWRALGEVLGREPVATPERLKAYAQGRPIADVAGDDEPGGDGVVDAQDLAAFMADYQSQNP